MSYWLFSGSPWHDQLGYDKAQDQHYRELMALGWAREFHPTSYTEATLDELIFRLDSLASWIEAEESLILWRGLNDNPAAWDSEDPIAQSQALGAAVISNLATITSQMSDWAIARMVESFRKWNRPQWTKVLKAATRSATRTDKPLSDLETWVWWRYPIFSRYHWSASEICRAAREKFGEVPDVNNEAAFQSAWVRRGLRFTGSRKKRPHIPLWEFVLSEPVPVNDSSDRSFVMWIPYGKSSRRS